MTVAPTLPGAVTVRAPAKVNLELRVGARRPDGFHDLATVFQAVSLHDEISVTRWDEWQVVPAGTYAALIPTDGDNLAVRAARLVAEQWDVDEKLSIRIDKDIPVAGGMAGGSADAAAALVACDQLWGLGLLRDELAELAATLGSDVPFPLTGGNAMGSGRGDQLAPVLARGTFHWVFAISDKGLSTPAVYAECDRLRDLTGSATSVPEPQVSSELMAALRSGDPVALGAALHNDLEPAVFSLRPDRWHRVRVRTDGGLPHREPRGLARPLGVAGCSRPLSRPAAGQGPRPRRARRRRPPLRLTNPPRVSIGWTDCPLGWGWA
jgi:4-diphosphocytidyl-2-C-methyl-D-erythritol kinase